ncbi:MAG: hypothetical protein ABIU54_05280, partial [Candidatus Eisenbacteria bacterium]
VLVVLLGAFTFWQVRIPFDGAHFKGGALATLRLEALALAAAAIAAGSLAHWRQSVLAAKLPGPEWLALPVPASLVARHLLAESRLPALAMAPLAFAVWLAGLDLMPWLWSALLITLYLVAWLECTRVGAALARAPRARGEGASRALPALMRLLVSGRSPRQVRPMPAARWRRCSPAHALVRLDQILSWRALGPRTRLLGALIACILSSVAWWSGAAPLLARAQSFVGFAIASAFLGGWVVLRTCGDPSDLLRQLPLSFGTLWRARFVQLAVVVGLFALAQAGFATAFPMPARIGQWVAWFVPGLAIATLGLHYGITLHPRGEVAENLYYGWLGVALCASLMIPLMGWAVVLAGLVHSSLRLSRWRTPEVA